MSRAPENIRIETATVDKVLKYNYRLLNQLNLETQAGARSKRITQLQTVVLNTIKELKKIQ